jgi:hypothetical protein
MRMGSLLGGTFGAFGRSYSMLQSTNSGREKSFGVDDDGSAVEEVATTGRNRDGGCCCCCCAEDEAVDEDILGRKEAGCCGFSITLLAYALCAAHWVWGGRHTS